MKNFTTRGVRCLVTVFAGLGLHGCDGVADPSLPLVNRAPVPVAQLSPTLSPGQTGVLDGSASSDPDGDALRFQWVQRSGQAVGLLNAASAIATFTAPSAPPAEPLVFSLVVTDARGLASDSLPVQVVVVAPLPVLTPVTVFAFTTIGGGIGGGSGGGSGGAGGGAGGGAAATLGGVGWQGSTSLADYPKTADTTSCDANCAIVDLDVANASNGNATDPLARFVYALGRLSSRNRVLLRNNTGVAVPLNSAVVRSIAWSSNLASESTGSYKQFFAYGAQRIKLDASAIGGLSVTGSLVFQGSAKEHWKGFELVGTRLPAVGGGVTGSISMEDAVNVKLEDFWIHDNTGGAAIYNRSHSVDCIFQDVIAWANGATGGVMSTHVPDGFDADSGTVRGRFVRSVSINGKDDGFDMWGCDHCQIIDCAAINSGKYLDGTPAGDGNGFKMGGNTTSAGGNQASGCIAVNSLAKGFSLGESYPDPVRLAHVTSADNGTRGFMFRTFVGDEFTHVISHFNGATEEPSLLPGSWNLVNDDGDPLFVSRAAGDYSLMIGSPGLGAGPGAANLGASEIALRLLKENWLRR